MKSLTVLLVSVCISVSGFCQSIKDELYADKNKMCSNYLKYQTPKEKYTPAPKGFKPFYISHYGRHGSRYHYSASDYAFFDKLFLSADSAQALTELGKSIGKRVHQLYVDAHQRAGDLTQTGAKQHIEIAKRMVQSYPDVFKGNAKIDVKASTSGRCIMSMDAFCRQLQAMNPQLSITAESSKRLMTYICNDSWDTISVYMSDTLWTNRFNALHEKYVKPERMMRALFSDSLYVEKYIDKVQFMRKFYEIYGSMQGIDDVNFDFADVFTDDELYGNWIVQNAWWYGAYGRCPLTHARGTKFAKNLLRNILDEADKALAGNGTSATLRFGHDTGLLPLCCLMELEGCNARTADLENLSNKWGWCDFKIIPMAGNLQMIFYKSKKSYDVLVKVLLNEREVDLPVYSDMAPYYKWNDVEQYYRNVLNE